MPINTEIFFKAATRGDVAGVALKAAVAIAMINNALFKLSNNLDIKDNMKEIGEKADELNKLFDELAGWSPEK